MSKKYQDQKLKDAIEVYQPGGADAPILYTSTYYNAQGFKALLGRKPNHMRSVAVSVLICCAIVIMVAAIASIILAGQAGAPVFVVYFPVFATVFIYRTTIIAVSETGIDFYLVNLMPGSKYVVYDKLSLPYDRITNVMIRAGKFNTRIAFEFSNGEKKYKIETSGPNKTNKLADQTNNMKLILETLEKATVTKTR